MIIKAYEKARMKPKNHARLEREVRLMQHLGGAESMVDLYAVFEDITHKYLVGFPSPNCSCLGITLLPDEMSTSRIQECPKYS